MSIRKVLLIVLSVNLLTAWKWQESINEYQKALNCYKEKKYFRAFMLFEEVIPQLRGQAEEANAYFCQGHCMFHLKDYVQSADVFNNFRSTFPADSRVEEALYMQGLASSYISPDFRLDQEATEMSVKLFENYLQQYPEGDYVSQAKDKLAVLKNRLQHKDLEAAKLYYRLGKFKAALVTLANLPKASFTDFDEEIAYLKVQAQYGCFEEDQSFENMNEVLACCQHFLATHPDSTNIPAVEAIKVTIQKHPIPKQ